MGSAALRDFPVIQGTRDQESRATLDIPVQVSLDILVTRVRLEQQQQVGSPATRVFQRPPLEHLGSRDIAGSAD